MMIIIITAAAEAASKETNSLLPRRLLPSDLEKQVAKALNYVIAEIFQRLISLR